MNLCSGLAIFGLSVRVLLAAVLASAGVAKLFSPEAASRALAALQNPFSPRNHVRIVRCMGALEVFLAGIVLFAARAAAWTCLVAGTMFVGFAAVLIVLRKRGYSAGCGCFGSIDGEVVTPFALLRNVVLALLAYAEAIVTSYYACSSSANNAIPHDVWLAGLVVSVTSVFVYLFGTVMVRSVTDLRRLSR
jgi:hypothetical protein